LTVSVLVSAGMLGGCQTSPAASDGTPTAGRPGGSTPVAAGGQCGGAVHDLASAIQVITDPIGCPGGVNTFWAKHLGDVWTQPRFLSYHDGEIPADACGKEDPDPDEFADNAFYCTLDDTVAYSEDFMSGLFKEGGPSYPMFVLMHEMGHRVSRLTDRAGVVSRAEENQADCLAGAESAFAHSDSRLPVSDVIGGAVLFFNLGDKNPDGGGWFNQEPSTSGDAHGTPVQRASAFGVGYLRDLDHCFTIGQSRSGQVSIF
jgi:hypothetical protein